MPTELQALLALVTHLLPAQSLTAFKSDDSSVTHRSASALATPQLQKVLLRLAELMPLMTQRHDDSPDQLEDSPQKMSEDMLESVRDAQLRLAQCVQLCHSSLYSEEMSAEQVS